LKPSLDLPSIKLAGFTLSAEIGKSIYLFAEEFQQDVILPNTRNPVDGAEIAEGIRKGKTATAHTHYRPKPLPSSR